ncbi:DUF983 domain-containing protein [Nibricoccus sp. IMCC34717]|uniref:DUF983 domain-containing protein n=1 Tax=Nibricoccus sp. IMCC34717 TaxID=3034021 RepID=UPI00384E5F70
MPIPRSEILLRGLTCACPSCGERALFEEGRLFQMRRECRKCGLPFERDEGSFLGAVALNYGVTTVCYLVPVLVGYLVSWYSGYTASVLALVGAIVVPVLLYRPSRSWWLMNYYLVFPEQLPGNSAGEREK